MTHGCVRENELHKGKMGSGHSCGEATVAVNAPQCCLDMDLGWLKEEMYSIHP